MWQEIREEERASRPALDVRFDADVCYFCEGTGWQTYEHIGDSGNSNTAVRACACSAAPMEFRKLQPLQAPEWQKRKHSVIWERNEVQRATRRDFAEGEDERLD